MKRWHMLAALITGIAYFILQTWMFAIVAIILLGGSLAFAFAKVNGRPLVKVVASAAHFYWRPQVYVWKPDHPVTIQHHAPTAVRELSPLLPASAQKAEEKSEPKTVEDVARGDALHKSWQSLQTGTPKAQSDRQFIEKKMAERYQIFQRQLGDRMAARRVDYR